MPKVSVMMAVYNMEKNVHILKKAVASILNQTYQDWELIICDDGSTDHTLQILRQISSEDERLHIISCSNNHGAGYARNMCMRIARGKYLAVMDADDISKPQRLKKQACFLDSHPQYALVGCNASMIDSCGVWGERILEEKPDKKDFLSTLPFVHPSIMIRKEVAYKLHGYTQTMTARRAEDYEFLMRLYAAGYRGCNMQEPLIFYREDIQSYRKRTYRCRLNECRGRYRGFLKLGILKGNFRYVLKPFVVGMIPAGIMRHIKIRRYGSGIGGKL